VLLLALASFGAIVVAWVVAPEGKPARVAEPTTSMPAQAVPARA
jgi:hypothetical protein